MLEAAAPLVPVDPRPCIDGRLNRGGLLEPRNWDRRRTGWSLGLYLFRRGTRHVLVLETPAALDFERRVAIHLRALGRVIGQMSRARGADDPPT